MNPSGKIRGKNMKNKDGYICRDCNGIALQFTGSGRLVQCEDGNEDVFETKEEAKSALKNAEEPGGEVQYKTSHKTAVKSATRKAGL